MSISLKANNDGSSELLNGSTKVMTIGADNKLYDKDGVKLVSGEALGVGQTWQDVTASRASDVTYTNNTGKPIVIVVTCFVNDVAGNGVTVDGLFLQFLSTGGSAHTDLKTFIIPNNSTYKVKTPIITKWLELR